MPCKSFDWTEKLLTLVLEGCDGAGKSSLANKLTVERAFRIVHSPPTPNDVDLAVRYRDLLSGSEKLVLDRSFVSEAVYGPIFRGHSRLTRQAIVELARLVAQRHGVIIYLKQPVDIILARLAQPGRTDSWDRATVEAILRQYENVLSYLTPHVPILRCDSMGT